MKISQYQLGQLVQVNDRMQTNYSYILSRQMGAAAADFHQQGFYPQLQPTEMLSRGVFEGRYLNDCSAEFPEEWFNDSTTKRSQQANPENNYFKVKSRLSLREWQDRR